MVKLGRGVHGKWSYQISTTHNPVLVFDFVSLNYKGAAFSIKHQVKGPLKCYAQMLSYYLRAVCLLMQMTEPNQLLLLYLKISPLPYLSRATLQH